MNLNRRIKLRDDEPEKNDGCFAPATGGIAFLVFVPLSYYLAGILDWI